MGERDAPFDREMLDVIERQSVLYFLREFNPANGLVRDRTDPTSPCSIAVVGLGLTVCPIAVSLGLMTREEAVERTRVTLRFFRNAPQGPEPDATGWRGLYYHFLDMESGRRTWQSELSTIDSAFLLAGALTAAVYFDRDVEGEAEIRGLADELYGRADWRWALDGGPCLSHGWKPETGFLRARWDSYSEAHILYALALGSPTLSIPPESYRAFTNGFGWKTIYGIDYFHAGPFFIHQLSHLWIDFRGLRDAATRAHGIDYFENSRRATLIQQQYAIRNPQGFEHYGDRCWGITASGGPGPDTRTVKGVKRRFYDYVARGVPDGLDDGTIAPWAVATALPFAPELVTPTLRYFIDEIGLKDRHEYGFEATFNGTYPDRDGSAFGWVSPYIWGLNQAPIVVMLENVRTGATWDLVRRCGPIVRGLRRAGFAGSWLTEA